MFTKIILLGLAIMFGASINMFFTGDQNKITYPLIWRRINLAIVSIGTIAWLLADPHINQLPPVNLAIFTCIILELFYVTISVITICVCSLQHSASVIKKQNTNAALCPDYIEGKNN